jgi:hypothetical protein
VIEVAIEVPGQTGQPPMEVQGPSFDTMGWVHSTNPNTDYAEGNPLQDTSPTIVKAWSNADQTMSAENTSNAINGGADMIGKGGV